jgi:epoxide hydrolase-like predicted phosphatase
MNPKLKIKYLIFDIGGVIVLSKRVNLEKFDRKWSLPKGTVRNIVNSCFNRMSLDKNFNLRKYFSTNFSHLLSFNQYRKVATELFKNERINKSLVHWIRKKKNKYTICLLTNNTAILNRLLKKKFKIYQDFDYIFNSAEVGLSKPDPNFFKYVLKKLKAESKECLFIDNNPKNIKVAKTLGFFTILFINNKNFFKKISNFLPNEK